MSRETKGSWVQRTHPLLYWVTIAYIVGLPNFLQFDATGRTHEFGLFNVTSISRIAFTLLTAYVLTINLAMGRGPIFPRKVNISIGIWLLLLASCTVSTILQPASRLSPRLTTDLPLSLFRLGEWILAFALLLALYTREPAERGMKLVIELIGRSSWITILIVWIALPFAPRLVYGMTDEPGSVAVLGGEFFNPGTLAFQASFAFLYTLLLFKQPYYRWLGCSVSILTLALTRARTPLIGFVIALGCYTLVYCGKPAVRFASVGLGVVFGCIGAVFIQPLAAYLTRGQAAETITSLDSRTVLWQACWFAIKQRPILGYGYVIGAKHAIRDYWLYSSQWVPPHAHNEFIQATLQAGLPAGVLVLYIYVWLFVRSVQAARSSREHLLCLLAVIQLVVIASTGMVIAAPFGYLGAVFLLCCFGCGRSLPGPQTIRVIEGHSRLQEVTS